MNPPTNRAELTKFIQLGVQESLHLDYKDSRALKKDRRDEIVKDVSAFSNTDGGLVIFGIIEVNVLDDEGDR